MEIEWKVLPQDAGRKLGVFLRRHGVSVTLMRRLKYEPRGLLRNGSRARSNEVLCENDCVALTLPTQEALSAQPEKHDLPPVYESEHAMVFNKPAGMATHPSGQHRSGTLANAFCGLMQQREQETTFRPVGRLDIGTSGLVLCAMNPFAAPMLAQSMQKTYIAIVQGCLKQAVGCIDLPLAALPGSAILQYTTPEGRPSRTDYEVLAQGEEFALVRVMPRMGRTHQIRAHFSCVGHPLLGDTLYGGSAALLDRHALHCAQLCFTEPLGGEVCLPCEMPPDMMAAANRLVPCVV